jgi:HSP20 family molecular chaperone IbpA
MKSQLEKKDVAERPFTRPHVDVWENDSELLVVADVPGVEREQVHVELEDGELRIEGRRSVDGRGAVLATEQRPFDYRRAFVVPDGIDAEKIAAELKDGVLFVHLPKTAAKRTRRIEVKTN